MPLRYRPTRVLPKVQYWLSVWSSLSTYVLRDVLVLARSMLISCYAVPGTGLAYAAVCLRACGSEYTVDGLEPGPYTLEVVVPSYGVEEVPALLLPTRTLRGVRRYGQCQGCYQPRRVLRDVRTSYVLLSAYARAMRSPVLTYRMLLPGEGGHTVCGCPGWGPFVCGTGAAIYGVSAAICGGNTAVQA
eukprot:836630-Rhodomonas_salina.1